jgi:uncharacterized membrane protein
VQLAKRLILLIVLLGCSSFLLPDGRVEGQTVANTHGGIYADGWYHVFGEVSNTGSTNISAKVSTTFRFFGGTVASSTYAMVDLLPPNQKAPFDLVLANSTLSSQVQSFDTPTLQTIPFNNVPYGFEFIENSTVIQNATDGSGRFHLGGSTSYINNTGTLNATFVQAIATFYDISGNVNYAGWTYVSSTNLTRSGTPGAKASFEIIASNTTAIKSYFLQFQCNEYAKAPTTPDFFLRTLTRTNTVTQGSSATYVIAVTPNSILNLTDNFVNLIASGLPTGASYTFIPNNITTSDEPHRLNLRITPSSTVGVGTGTFLITITASNNAAIHQISVILNVFSGTDFGITVNPPSRSIVQGVQAFYTVTVLAGGGFSSPVTLNISGTPSGSTAAFSSTIVIPTSGGNQTGLSITTSLSTTTGVFQFIVCGKAGSLSHCATASVNVSQSITPFFDLSISPSSNNVFRGSSTTFVVRITSVNSFNQPVSLQLTSHPSGTAGVFSPSPVTPPLNGFAQSTLNISVAQDASPGTYNITITGTPSLGSPKSYQVTITISALSAPDFAVYVLPTTLSVAQNSSGTATIQVVSINGFADTVTLTLQNAPTGVTYSIGNPVVAPLPGGYVNTKLTIQTSSSTSLGPSTLTLRGSSTSKTHTTPLELYVVNRTSSFGKCIIATATYGSELTPEVQFLRGFRDNRVLSTIAGTEFIEVFNTWYYSFSPQVASWIVQTPSVRDPMKILLLPLLGILHLSEISYMNLAFAPEIAVTIAGLIASLLIGIIYIGPVLAVASRRAGQKRYEKLLTWAALVLVFSILFMAVGLRTFILPLIMITSSILVLSAIILGSLLVPLLALKILSRNRL